MIDEVKQRQQSLGLQVTDEVDYQFLSYCVMETEDGFKTDYMAEDMEAIEKLKNLVILSEEDYNRIEDANLSLKNQEALVIGVPKTYEKSELTLFDDTFSVKKGDHIGLQNNRVMSNAVDSYFVVVKDREILQLRPGITGPASMKYRNEEELLAKQEHPHRYNDDVLFPDKVRLNRYYLHHYSFAKDIQMIVCTILGRQMKYADEII